MPDISKKLSQITKAVRVSLQESGETRATLVGITKAITAMEPITNIGDEPATTDEVLKAVEIAPADIPVETGAVAVEPTSGNDRKDLIVKALTIDKEEGFTFLTMQEAGAIRNNKVSDAIIATIEGKVREYQPSRKDNV